MQRPSIAVPGTGTKPAPTNEKYDLAIERLRKRWGDKFVEPRTNQKQIWYFGVRVEVVSPSGYTRRGVIGITSGWAPSLLLVHRRGGSGSSDLLNENDIVVGWVDAKHKLQPIDHDKLQVAVYQSQGKEEA